MGHQKIDAFELWCWRRLFRVPGTARRSNQSILKEISPEYSLEGLMLKVKLQYFGHLMQRADLLEKTLMLGKMQEDKGMTEDETVGWYHRLNEQEFKQVLEDGKAQESLACYSPRGLKQSDMTDLLSNNILGMPFFNLNLLPTIKCTLFLVHLKYHQNKYYY